MYYSLAHICMRSISARVLTFDRSSSSQLQTGPSWQLQNWRLDPSQTNSSLVILFFTINQNQTCEQYFFFFLRWHFRDKGWCQQFSIQLLLGSCCCILTLRILHFKLHDILICKIFFIGFLNELGNFKQKKIYILKCTFFTFYSNGP